MKGSAASIERGDDDKEVGLKKSLGVLGCVSFLLQLIIGSGIFIMPNGVIKEVGSIGSALIIWVACGVYSIFGALSYSELGCMIPKTGGEYEYFKIAFGDLFGFLFVWAMTFIYNPASTALAALTFSDYALQWFFPTCEIALAPRLCLAAAAIILMTIINSFSVKAGSYLGYLFNLGKIGGILLIVFFGGYGIYMGRVEELMNPFEGSSTNPAKYGIAFVAGYFSYTGWQALGNVVEEVKNPNRTFPLSILIGLTFSTTIYFFANIAFFTFLTPREVMNSKVVAFTFLERVIGKFSAIMSVCVGLSTLGFVNAIIFQASRTIFAAANNNHMPYVFSLISLKYHTPMVSVIFAGILSLIYLFFKDIYTLLNIAMVVFFLNHIGTIIALLWLRRSQPDTPRPIKVNLFFPIVFLLISCYITFMIFLMHPTDFFLCIFTYFIGIIGYYFFVKCKKPQSIKNKINTIVKAAQKLTLSMPEQKND